MIIYHNQEYEDDLPCDFTIKINDIDISCKQKVVTKISPLIDQMILSSSSKKIKFQIEKLNFDQKNISRTKLLLNGNDILVTKENFEYYQKISDKLNVQNFSKFLEEVDTDSLESNYQLLSTLESFFKMIIIDTNFDTAIQIFPSIVTEVDIKIFLNLVYHICYTSSKNMTVKKIFDFIQKVSLTFPFLSIFNSDQDQISLETGQFYMYQHRPQFEFLSYFSYIPKNQIIMKEMKERKIEYELYRPKYGYYEFFKDDTSFQMDNEIIKVINDDDIDSLQRIVNSNLSSDYFQLKMRLHSEKDRFNYEMYLTDIAAYFGSLKCFKYLICNQAAVGNDLPIFAILGQNYEIVHVCDQKYNSSFNNLCVEAAFMCHNVELFQWLTENKNFFNASYYSKLFIQCIKTSNYGIFNYIYEYCNDLNENLLNNKSLFTICEMNNSILFEWYLEKVKKIEQNDLQLCFYYASKGGDTNFINHLFDLGIKKYDRYMDASPLHYLTIKGDLDIIKKTLDLNRKVLNVSCQFAKFKLTPLMIAFKYKRYDVAEFFLSQKDLDLNACGSIENVFLSMNVYHFVYFFEDEKAFSYLINKKIIKNLDLTKECVVYKKSNFWKDMETITLEDLFEQSDNKFFRSKAKLFHKQ